MKLLYFAPLSWGGMAEYSHYQASALARVGITVTMLCPADGKGPWHRIRAGALPYEVRPILHGWRVPPLPALLRKTVFARNLLQDAGTLATVTRREHFPRVLFAAYSEHFAPIWAGSLRRISRECGTVFGVVVHDPTRTGGFGPRWWHRWSVAAVYSAVREAFVHSPLTLDTRQPMPGLRTSVIPHGIYEVPSARVARGEWRAKHGLPAGARVLLSFGHIRDNKNIDLALRALAHFPELYWVVAGKEQSNGQKNVQYYRGLAKDLRVADRCRWLTHFIPDEEIGEIFCGCDLLLLTYGRDFRSASGVLNLGANFRMTCLASGGDGNLRDCVQKYGLGAWVDADNVDALVAGIDRSLHDRMPTPRWDEFITENSWQRNAEIVAEKMDALG